VRIDDPLVVGAIVGVVIVLFVPGFPGVQYAGDGGDDD
jgi:hypothetical protein